jgi:hypothetical protein
LRRPAGVGPTSSASRSGAAEDLALDGAWPISTDELAARLNGCLSRFGPENATPVTVT